MTEEEMSETKAFVSVISASASFQFVSDFVLRISDFPRSGLRI
jgi:hypothetical protein